MSAFLAKCGAVWPGTLYLRLVAVWFLLMLVTHLSYVAVAYFGVTAYESGRTSYYLSKDMGLLVPALEAAQPAQRQAWLARMERDAYRFELNGARFDAPATDPGTQAARLAGDIAKELGPRYPVSVRRGGDGNSLIVRLALSDGSVLTAHVAEQPSPLNLWGFLSFVLQIVAMLIFTAIAARQATGPLSRLTAAAESLGSSMQCEPIAEHGPLEVARAAAAFNVMGRRIKDHLAERVRLLAAISHDLQTPITRMRLRTDLLENGALKAKFDSDLDAMQVLVEEGIAYARSTDQVQEQACRVDIDAMLDALAGDYADGGHQVALCGTRGLVLLTWPNTLRRIIVNLADNAIKFGGQVEIETSAPGSNQLVISVRDRGPGIDAAQLDAVFEPFYRLETSRNRGTGGTGLGLAIARQLCMRLGGTLTLANREGGGLIATLAIPTPPPIARRDLGAFMIKAG